MKNILVPVGSVEAGINNLRYAINFAGISQAKVFITCVEQGNVESVLREILDNVNIKGVKVVSKIISGNIYEGIASLCRTLNIDLMILAPQSVDINNKVYLGKITGKIVRESETPLLVVPRDYLFRRFDNIMMAFKNANFTNEANLEPIESVVEMFGANLDLLHVKTPDSPKSAAVVNKRLMSKSTSYTQTKNATVFQGVLENYQKINPEMICLLRRKKQNMFEKFWKSNEILKEEFHSSKPLLILKERE